MDGPNVNFKMLALLQNEHSELHGDAQLISVGSCGLHTLHNAMKAGFTTWQVDKLLRALHDIFHNFPACREYYTSVTGSSTFPRTFCGHRWVENVNVASYDTILSAQSDDFIKAKLQFFLLVARGFCPFLMNYQTDESVLPFLAKDLTELLMVMINYCWDLLIHLNMIKLYQLTDVAWLLTVFLVLLRVYCGDLWNGNFYRTEAPCFRSKAWTSAWVLNLHTENAHSRVWSVHFAGCTNKNLL